MPDISKSAQIDISVPKIAGLPELTDLAKRTRDAAKASHEFATSLENLPNVSRRLGQDSSKMWRDMMDGAHKAKQAVKEVGDEIERTTRKAKDPGLSGYGFKTDKKLFGMAGLGKPFGMYSKAMMGGGLGAAAMGIGVGVAGIKDMAGLGMNAFHNDKFGQGPLQRADAGMLMGTAGGILDTITGRKFREKAEDKKLEKALHLEELRGKKGLMETQDAFSLRRMRMPWHGDTPELTMQGKLEGNRREMDILQKGIGKNRSTYIDKMQGLDRADMNRGFFDAQHGLGAVQPGRGLTGTRLDKLTDWMQGPAGRVGLKLKQAMGLKMEGADGQKNDAQMQTLLTGAKNTVTEELERRTQLKDVIVEQLAIEREKAGLLRSGIQSKRSAHARMGPLERMQATELAGKLQRGEKLTPEEEEAAAANPLTERLIQKQREKEAEPAFRGFLEQGGDPAEREAAAKARQQGVSIDAVLRIDEQHIIDTMTKVFEANNAEIRSLKVKLTAIDERQKQFNNQTAAERGAVVGVNRGG